MLSIPSKCPICGSETYVESVRCTNCETVVTNKFAISKFDKLTESQADFVLTFIGVEGNIKEMEKALGISYPTVKSRLNDIREILGLNIKNQTEDIHDEDTFKNINVSEIVQNLVKLGKSSEEIAAAVANAFSGLGEKISKGASKVFETEDGDFEFSHIADFPIANDGFSSKKSVFVHVDTDLQKDIKIDDKRDFVEVNSEQGTIVRQSKKTDKEFLQCTLQLKYNKGAFSFEGDFSLDRQADFGKNLKPFVSQTAWQHIMALIEEKFVGSFKFVSRQEVLKIEIA